MTEHKQPVSDEYNANLAAAILRQPSQEASSLPVVAYLCKYGEIYQQPDDVLETDIPLIRLTDAQSQLTAMRAERDEWHDRATEAQAERDAAREERDALKAAPKETP